jgi:hypothetical protein
MSGMVDAQDALGDDPCTVAGIRAIDERDEGLVELEITVSCSPESPWKDRPGQHPWFMRFHPRVLLIRGPGTTGVFGPDGRIKIAVPRGEIEDFIRAVRQAARDTDAEYRAFVAQQQEQAQREAQAEPAKRARLAEDQARIDAVLAETDETE